VFLRDPVEGLSVSKETFSLALLTPQLIW